MTVDRYCHARADARRRVLARAEQGGPGRLHHRQLGQHTGGHAVQLPEVRPQVGGRVQGVMYNVVLSQED